MVAVGLRIRESPPSAVTRLPLTASLFSSHLTVLTLRDIHLPDSVLSGNQGAVHSQPHTGFPGFAKTKLSRDYRKPGTRDVRPSPSCSYQLMLGWCGEDLCKDGSAPGARKLQ